MADEGAPSDVGESLTNVVKTLNSHLPEDIRVFAVTRINHSFVARDSCQWRGYDYYMPVDMLSSENNPVCTDVDAQQLVDKLNVFLKQMEGCHGFHNFHRLSGKELKKVGVRTWKKDLTPTSTPCSDKIKIEEDEDIEEEIKTELPLSDEFKSEGKSPFSNCFDDGWTATPREMHEKTKCTTYRCHAEVVRFPNSDKPMVKVHIMGHYFLLQ